MNSSVSVRSDTSGAAQFEASHREQSLAIEGSEAALSRQASVASLASVDPLLAVIYFYQNEKISFFVSCFNKIRTSPPLISLAPWRVKSH